MFTTDLKDAIREKLYNGLDEGLKNINEMFGNETHLRISNLREQTEQVFDLLMTEIIGEYEAAVRHNLSDAPRNEWFVGIWMNTKAPEKSEVAVVKIVRGEKGQEKIIAHPKAPMTWPTDWRPL